MYIEIFAKKKFLKNKQRHILQNKRLQLEHKEPMPIWKMFWGSRVNNGKATEIVPK